MDPGQPYGTLATRVTQWLHRSCGAVSHIQRHQTFLVSLFPSSFARVASYLWGVVLFRHRQRAQAEVDPPFSSDKEKMVCSKCQKKVAKTELVTPAVKKKSEMYYGSHLGSSAGGGGTRGGDSKKLSATLGNTGVSKV